MAKRSSLGLHESFSAHPQVSPLCEKTHTTWIISESFAESIKNTTFSAGSSYNTDHNKLDVGIESVTLPKITSSFFDLSTLESPSWTNNILDSIRAFLIQVLNNESILPLPDINPYETNIEAFFDSLPSQFQNIDFVYDLIENTYFTVSKKKARVQNFKLKEKLKLKN